jgi:hypothetical protein
MSDKPRFIRVRGRIVPIRDKKGYKATAAGSAVAGGAAVGGAIASANRMGKTSRALGRFGAVAFVGFGVAKPLYHAIHAKKGTRINTFIKHKAAAIAGAVTGALGVGAVAAAGIKLENSGALGVFAKRRR